MPAFLNTQDADEHVHGNVICAWMQCCIVVFPITFQ